MKRWITILALSAISACIPDDIDLEGRPCPCLDGAYVCVDMICVLTEDVVDAGAVDSMGGLDAPDAPGQDAMDIGPIGMDGGPTKMDGGPADGGPSDGGPNDAGDVEPDAPVGSFCERHGMGAYRCLDFETDLATLGWSAMTSDPESTLDIDATRAVSGSSLRVTTGMGGSAYLEQIVPAVDSGTFWYRARVLVDDPTAVRFWPFMAVGGLGAENNHYTYAGLVSAQRVLVSHRKGAVENAEASTLTYANGAWFCVEVSVDTQVSGEVKLYVGGELVVSNAVDGSGSWRRVNVGSVGSDSGQPFRTIWVDDFVFSPTRVPCDLE